MHYLMQPVASTYCTQPVAALYPPSCSLCCNLLHSNWCSFALNLMQPVLPPTALKLVTRPPLRPSLCVTL